MQGSNKELAFLGEEQDKIKSQDWSDRMVDPPDVRRQYEVRTDGLLRQNRLLSLNNEIVLFVRNDSNWVICLGDQTRK